MQVQRETQLFNNGINYDPFHPDGYTSMRKVLPAHPHHLSRRHLDPDPSIPWTPPSSLHLAEA